MATPVNEQGRALYPKICYPNGKDQPYIIVNSSVEEAEVMKVSKQEEVKVEEKKEEPKQPAWGDAKKK